MMDVNIIELLNTARQSLSLTLDGQALTLTIFYLNSFSNGWYITISSGTGDSILSGVRMNSNIDILSSNGLKYTSKLFVLPRTDNTNLIEFDGVWGITHDLVTV